MREGAEKVPAGSGALLFFFFKDIVLENKAPAQSRLPKHASQMSLDYLILLMENG